MKEKYHCNDVRNLYTFPPSFEQYIELRDQRCFITGTSKSEADLCVSWMFPPPWAFQLTDQRNPHICDYTPFITTSNAGLMREDLAALFHENAFGIDVDDDYRIVRFREISVTLPSHLPRSGNTAHAGPEDKFMREQFRWCLIANLLGGDIEEDYSMNDIGYAMEELGMGGNENELAPMDDEHWNTILGKEILERYMQSQLHDIEYPEWLELRDDEAQ